MAPHTLTTLENELETRKLWAPKVKGVKNSKKQSTEHYKADSQALKFSFCMLFFYY